MEYRDTRLSAGRSAFRVLAADRCQLCPPDNYESETIEVNRHLMLLTSSLAQFW